MEITSLNLNSTMKHNIQGQEHRILCEKKLETNLHFDST
jgi:hypothetical protein